MSLYFSVSDPSGKFLSATELLDPSVQAMKEASEKTSGDFTLSFSKDHCFWHPFMEAKDGRVSVTDSILYADAQKFNDMAKSWRTE